MTHDVHDQHLRNPSGSAWRTPFVISSGVLIVFLSACAPHEEPAPLVSEPEHPNKSLLDEVNVAEMWFRARKTRPIWARQLTHAERIETLEGVEEVPAGQMLCRGEAGDIWPQSAERLAKKYEATGETDAEGWQKHIPAADNQGVMAAKVPHAFQVQAAWGLLSGKPGDFLVKNFEDRETDYPEDVWIVDQALFRATYEEVSQ